MMQVLCLKPSKCEFFKKRVEYLGHIVSENGIETNPKKIKDIINWPLPNTVTQLRSFLGFCNYYRKFIQDYAKISRILYKQISGENAKKKGNKINWILECQEAFSKLKAVCSETPVLAYADYTKPYKVAHEINEKESARHKKYYDKKYKCMKILPGDLVLVRVKAFGADHKIADRWEQIPYEVLEQMDKSPVYKVQTIQGPDSTKVRTLHRNMLFPLQSKKRK